MAEQEVKNPDETMEEAVDTAEETADAAETAEAEATEGTK